LANLKSEGNPFYRNFNFILLVILILIGSVYAETALDEGFESFTIGSISGQNGWVVSNGSCIITDDSNYVKAGNKGSQFFAARYIMRKERLSEFVQLFRKYHHSKRSRWCGTNL